MIGGILVVVNFFMVLFNKSTLRIPGLDIIPFIVAWTGSLSLTAAAVGFQLAAELENLSTTWVMAVAALLAVFVAMINPWAGFVAFYAFSMIIAFFSRMFGARFLSFLVVSVALNGALLVLFA